MKRNKPHHPLASALLGAGLALLLSGGTLLGCTETPMSPSMVTKLRILGLSPSPPEPSPGETMTLDLLWTDPPPFCSSEEPCDEGRHCVDGRCQRDDESVEIAWVVASLWGWEPSETTIAGFGDASCTELRCEDLGEILSEQIRELTGLDIDVFPRCEPGDICPDGTPCRGNFCGGCASFSGTTFCCGHEELSSIEHALPTDMQVPPLECADTSLDISRIVQAQAQICAGGRLNLCPDSRSWTFGCDGENAESVTAVTRMTVVPDGSTANREPTIESALWGEDEWLADDIIEVPGCREEKCADRACDDDEECGAGELCESGKCRIELTIAADSAAQETYIEPCDAEESCSEDGDCPSRFVCRDETCLHIENPVTAFFATSGAFTPGRVVLDTSGNGRPNDEVFETVWLPPVMDECAAADDPCTFGVCDPAQGLCTGDISFWVVIRDGRGGQSWIERTVRIVP